MAGFNPAIQPWFQQLLDHRVKPGDGGGMVDEGC
jgi:hypothetical protein